MTHPDAIGPIDRSAAFPKRVRRINHPQPDGTFLVRLWRCHPDGELIAPLENDAEEYRAYAPLDSLSEEEQDENEQ